LKFAAALLEDLEYSTLWFLSSSVGLAMEIYDRLDKIFKGDSLLRYFLETWML